MHVGQWQDTYSAARVVLARLRDELLLGGVVLAGSAEVVTLDLDAVVELLVGGRAVLEDGQPLAVVLANTKVDGSPVADGLAAITPLATLLGRDTLGVDVVLSGSGLALPLVVGLTVRAGQGLELRVAQAKRDGLRFGTCIVSLDDVPGAILTKNHLPG
jgi:hypothetical protein